MKHQAQFILWLTSFVEDVSVYGFVLHWGNDSAWQVSTAVLSITAKAKKKEKEKKEKEEEKMEVVRKPCPPVIPIILFYFHVSFY